MENTVFERNYEIAEKDDRATAVFERAFAPGGFMEEFTKKMDSIPKVVVPKDKENYEYLLNRCDDYAKRHHGRIRGVVDYEHWDAHIDLYLRMLEFDDAEDMAFAANYIVENHGGIVVVDGGKVLASVVLEIAGIMSDEPLTKMNEELEAAKDAAFRLGVSRGIDPFMTLSFMALPVIPTLRITTRGVIDVNTQQYI